MPTEQRGEGSEAMGADWIQATDKVDIDTGWLKVEAYLAERGIYKAPNSNPQTVPVFWAQVDALQQSDPELSRLLMALTMSTRRGLKAVTERGAAT
jgi:hypothetical protein